VFIWHWILTVTGINSTSSYWNAFWGGFGSDLAEFAIFAIVWRKINCHAKGCYRIGLHHVAGTHYITCRKHHPVHAGARPATAEHIAQAHDKAQRAAQREATADAATELTGAGSTPDSAS
jgi:hypothetical protein